MDSEHEGLCPTAGVISKSDLPARSEFEILRDIPQNLITTPLRSG
ncbi:hypothetical protein ACKGJO_11190 [Gracilimonas sp. Q87]